MTTKQEAAKQIREWSRFMINGKNYTTEVAEMAAAALEREAAREEAERPKVTLAEQERYIRHESVACGDCGHDSRPCSTRLAAASTMKRLAEEGGKLLCGLREAGLKEGNTTLERTAIDLLIKLGCGERP